MLQLEPQLLSFHTMIRDRLVRGSDTSGEVVEKITWEGESRKK